MIYPLGGLLIGAMLGAYRARSRGGKPADMALWGAVFALILGIIGLFIMIAITRMYS